MIGERANNKKMPRGIYNHYKIKGLHPKSEFKKGRISNRKGVKLSDETKKKISENSARLSGEKHYRWIKDRNLLKKQNRRNDPLYFSWRTRVWVRDDWRCKLKSKYCKGKIECHHILGWTEYPDLRYEITNGITLCHFHHPRKKKDEKRLISKFKKIVATA